MAAKLFRVAVAALGLILAAILAGGSNITRG